MSDPPTGDPKTGGLEAIFPLTAVQEGMLFHSLYSEGSPLYFQQFTCDIDGPLDVEHFTAAWDEVIGRHSAMRSFMTWEGRSRPLQIVKTTVRAPWQVSDWRELPAERQSESWQEFLARDREAGLHLDQAPLMRFALMRVTPSKSRFVWSHHHIVLDGWSMGVVLTEVFSVYDAVHRGVEPGLPDPPSLRSFVQWAADTGNEGSEEFWKRELAEVNSPTSLRIEDPEVSDPWAADQSRLSTSLSPEDTRGLIDAARQAGVTLNTMVRGALALVMSRYSGQDSVLFGATVAGRPPELEGSLQMVGMFLNSVPVRIKIDETERLGKWLQLIQERQIETTSHERMALVDIQRCSAIPSGSPLFQTLLAFENVPVNDRLSTIVSVGNVEYLQRSNYPLAVLVMPSEQLEVTFLYDPKRYAPDSMARMLDQIMATLQAMTADVERPVGSIGILTPSEESEVLVGWNQTDAPYPASKTIDEIIGESARNNSGRMAVVCGGDTLTYSELWSQSAKLAGVLVESGLGSGSRIAVLAERSAATIVAIVGVLRSGAAYVPIDPSLPNSRVATILADSGARAIVTADARDQGNSKFGIPEVHLDGLADSPSQTIVRDHNPESLAYVIFTSGTTGRPKGVAISQRSLVASNHARTSVYPNQIKAFLLFSPLFFDSSVAGLFSTLTQGGTLVLPRPDEEKDVRAMARLIESQSVSHTLAIPSLYSLLLENAEPGELASLETVMVAGEPCPPQVVAAHFAKLPTTELVNEYGPTEATVWATFYKATGDDISAERLPIGRPVPNYKAFILDKKRRPVPVGVPGELFIGGVGLADGYLGRGSSEKSFVISDLDQIGQIRLYATGDLARFLPDGNIDLLGRTDRQVKVRGVRVELEEIEAAIRAHPDVRAAAVVAVQSSHQVVLHAFVESDVDPSIVETHLRGRLPDTMVPSTLTMLESLPRGATGKVDYAALPDPVPKPQVDQENRATHTPLKGPVEMALGQIWAEVLGIKEVGRTDNFFSLGGDSILIIRAIARAHQAGFRISPKDFFATPTVAGLSDSVQSTDAEV